MNLSNWLEAHCGSISPADNVRSRLACTARSAKQRELAKQQVCAADRERAAQSVATQPAVCKQWAAGVFDLQVRVRLVVLVVPYPRLRLDPPI